MATEQLRFRIPNTHKATDAIKNLSGSASATAGEKVAIGVLILPDS